MNSEQQNIEMNFDIGRVVLHGLDLTPSQQRQMSRALETTLKQRFDANGIPDSMSSGSSSASLPVNEIRLTGETVQPAALGRQIANSIYEGLSK